MNRAATFILALLFALPASLACQTSDTRFTDPPGPDTPESQALFAKARQALESGKADVSAVLSDRVYMPLHERTPFRQLIRDHAKSSRVKIVTAQEPGPRMVASGRILRADGKPSGGTLVYVYQTSAKGWYSDRAAHFGANSGDQRHARLFGYLVTDAQGRFEVETIRPEGYPQSDLPQHIHIEIFPEGGSNRITEITFEDDPRMTPEMRRSVERQGYALVPVTRGKDGVERCSAEIRLRG